MRCPRPSLPPRRRRATRGIMKEAASGDRATFTAPRRVLELLDLRYPSPLFELGDLSGGGGGGYPLAQIVDLLLLLHASPGRRPLALLAFAGGARRLVVCLVVSSLRRC